MAKPRRSSPRLFLPSAWDLLVGVPAGLVIFMATLLFNTIIGLRFSLPEFGSLIILGLVSLSVGMLTGITRLKRGPATALVAGLTVAGILTYLIFAAKPGDHINNLVIGPGGILTTILISPIGGGIGARTRKAL
jgi:hypothetical protein